MDLFMGAREADRHAHRELALAAGLANIRDQFVLGSLMGIKPRLMGLFFARGNKRAGEL